jgi:hypothetical protein
MATAGDTDVQWRALAGLYCSTACALDWTLEEALRRPLVVRVLSRAMDAYEPDRLDPGDDNHRNTIHMELERRRSRVPLAG